MLQNFLAVFGGVGGACALITLLLRIWPGALDALATGLYAHVRPERLPYDSPLSQYFAKTRTLGERTAKIDDRMDELCRDTIKNTLISLIYGDQSHDHSEAVRYELAKLEKLDAHCWIVAAAEKYLRTRNDSSRHRRRSLRAASRRDSDFQPFGAHALIQLIFQGHPDRGWLFILPRNRVGRRLSWMM